MPPTEPPADMKPNALPLDPLGAAARTIMSRAGITAPWHAPATMNIAMMAGIGSGTKPTVAIALAVIANAMTAIRL